MSKLDKKKTIIDFLKSIIITLIVGLFGMISYVFINVDVLTIKQLILITLAIVFDIIALSLIVKAIVTQINDLEDL
jgi:hypothetical protein